MYLSLCVCVEAYIRTRMYIMYMYRYIHEYMSSCININNNNCPSYLSMLCLLTSFFG